MPQSMLARVVSGALLCAVHTASLAQGQTAKPENAGTPPLAEVPMADAKVIADNSYDISFTDDRLSGPGVDLLRKETAGAQFVLLAEYVWHVDNATPRFAQALFLDLHQRAGFDYYAAEQDHFGSERISRRPLRGDLDRIVAFVRDNPYALTFINDEELRLLATVGRASSARGDPVWGFDQAFGMTSVVAELAGLAPDKAARAAAEELLAFARQNEVRVPDFGDWRGTRDFETGHAMSRQSVALVDRIRRLRAAYRPRPGSRQDEILTGLEQSALIYSYGQRAQETKPAEGVPVAWFNSSVRERLMRDYFLAEYRSAAAGGKLPKVLVKAGSQHLFQGRTATTNTFPIGNFFHELATFNGTTALTIAMVPIQPEDWTDASQLPADLQPLLGSHPLTRPLLVDLRPLRNHFHVGARFGLRDPASGARFRDLIYGADFVLFLPSRRASFSLTSEA